MNADLTLTLFCVFSLAFSNTTNGSFGGLVALETFHVGLISNICANIFTNTFDATVWSKLFLFLETEIDPLTYIQSLTLTGAYMGTLYSFNNICFEIDIIS